MKKNFEICGNCNTVSDVSYEFNLHLPPPFTSLEIIIKKYKAK